MSYANPITKVTQVIQRVDGSEARIVVTAMFGQGLHQSIDVCVHRREGPDSQWELCSNRPHPDWRAMPVEDYINHGRSEMLKVVSAGEILKVVSLVGTELEAEHVERFEADEVIAADFGDQSPSC